MVGESFALREEQQVAEDEFRSCSQGGFYLPHIPARLSLYFGGYEGRHGCRKRDFQKYLGGELPEELISLSRRHVQENQNQSLGDSKRRGSVREQQRKGTQAAAG